MFKTLRVLKEVFSKRRYQNKKWGGVINDCKNSEQMWLAWISEYGYGTGRAEGRTFRERMLNVAALAVAAIEAEDYDEKS